MTQQSNQLVFTTSRVVRSYSNPEKLQPPEETILNILTPEMKDRRILDIGVGGGRTTPYFLAISEDYVGVDYSSDMIRKCRERYPTATFEVCDARDLSPFPAASFDLVMFSFSGIDYVDHNGRMRVLSEVRRVLAPDGIFVFSAHNRDTKVRRSWDPSHFAGRQLLFHPLRLAKRIVLYAIGIVNSLKRQHREEHHPDYAILNDEAHEYALLTYYISVGSQVEQLREFGFENIRTFGLDGTEFDRRKTVRHDPWIYYLCRP